MSKRRPDPQILSPDLLGTNLLLFHECCDRLGHVAINEGLEGRIIGPHHTILEQATHFHNLIPVTRIGDQIEKAIRMTPTLPAQKFTR